MSKKYGRDSLYSRPFAQRKTQTQMLSLPHLQENACCFFVLHGSIYLTKPSFETLQELDCWAEDEIALRHLMQCVETAQAPACAPDA